MLEAHLSYVEQFLADLEHLRCEDDCEGFRDPCRACIVHEALRRVRNALSDAEHQREAMRALVDALEQDTIPGRIGVPYARVKAILADGNRIPVPVTDKREIERLQAVEEAARNAFEVICEPIYDGENYEGRQAIDWLRTALSGKPDSLVSDLEHRLRVLAEAAVEDEAEIERLRAVEEVAKGLIQASDLWADQFNRGPEEPSLAPIWDEVAKLRAAVHG